MKKLLISLLLLTVYFGYSQTTAGEYTIQLLKENSTNSDFGVTLYGDDKIIFSSARGGLFSEKWDNGQPFLDLYEGTINTDGQVYKVKNLSTRLDSPYHESSVAFSPDNKTVYFTRNNTTSETEGKIVNVNKEKNTHRRRKKGSKEKLVQKVKKTYLSIYKADVTSNGEWKNTVSLPFNNPNYSVGHPTVNRDNTKLYFTSDMYGSYGMTDIFYVDINSDGTYSKPKNLGRRVNTLGQEMFPFIDKNNILYFASDSRDEGLGGLDIYAVKIYEDSFSEVLHLGNIINTEKDDFAFVINNDNNNGYFSSNRKGGIGDDDIYHFIAEPPLKFGCTQMLTGIVKDNNNKKVGDVKVTIFDDKGVAFGSTMTKSNGKYKIKIPCDKTLKVVANKLSYNDGEKDLITQNNPKGESKVDLSIEKIIICMQNVEVSVKNTRTLKPVPYAMLTIFDANGSKFLTKKATKKGMVKFELPCKMKYKFAVATEKYDDSDELLFTTKEGNSTQKVVINQQLTPNLDEIKILDNKVVVNVKAIYFPLNSANITPTAAVELNKVVEMMYKYPKLKIEGGSHTDSRGGSDLNMKLSTKRANATVGYILSKGISSSRISAKGYGETQPVNKCVDGVRCTNEEYQLNRRTEFVILNPEVLGYY